MGESLTRLVYVSAAAGPLFADRLDRILLHARAHNKQADITGLMLFQDGRFVQVLEGSREAVLDTFARIRRDRTHKDMSVIGWGPIAARCFATAPMAYIAGRNLTETQRAHLRELVEMAAAQTLRHPEPAPDSPRIEAMLAAFAELETA